MSSLKFLGAAKPIIARDDSSPEGLRRFARRLCGAQMAFTRTHQTNYNLVLVVQPTAFLYIFHYRMTEQAIAHILRPGPICVIAHLSGKGEVLTILPVAVMMSPFVLAFSVITPELQPCDLCPSTLDCIIAPP